MRIGELAKSAQCPVETIRYYEKEGLLPKPDRSTSNYRRYKPAHLKRLCFIRNCRALNMTHDEIRRLLTFSDDPSSACDEVNQLLDEHIEHVRERIQELHELQQQLSDLRAQCSSHCAAAACGILQGLSDMASESKHARHTHLG